MWSTIFDVQPENHNDTFEEINTCDLIFQWKSQEGFVFTDEEDSLDSHFDDRFFELILLGPLVVLSSLLTSPLYNSGLQNWNVIFFKNKRFQTYVTQSKIPLPPIWNSAHLLKKQIEMKQFILGFLTSVIGLKPFNVFSILLSFFTDFEHFQKHL